MHSEGAGGLAGSHADHPCLRQPVALSAARAPHPRRRRACA
jgi:hypothetical protein